MVNQEKISRFLQRQARRATFVRFVELSLAGIAAGGICGAIYFTLAAIFPMSFLGENLLIGFSFPLIGVCLSALFTLIFMRVDVRQVVKFLDEKYQQKQKLSTANELISKSDNTGAAELVYQQALQFAEIPPSKLSYWQISKRRPTASLLAIMLCFALGLLAMWRTAPGEDSARIAEAIAGLSQKKLAELSDAFRKAADQTDDNVQAEKLGKISEVIEISDKDVLAKMIAELQSAGVKLKQVLPEQLQNELGIGDNAGLSPRTPSHSTNTEPDAKKDDFEKGKVAVFNPEYLEHISSGQDDGKTRSENAMSDFENVWGQVKKDSLERVNAGSYPAEYSGTMRNFFDSSR